MGQGTKGVDRSMMQAREKIDQIIQEIELPENMSGKQIGERILGRKLGERPSQVRHINLEIEQLKEYVEKNNQLYVIALESEESVSFPKRIFRKLQRRLLASVLEQETEFHASVTCSVNHLYNNMCLTQQFMDEQTNRIRRLEEELSQQQYFSAVNDEKIRELYQRLEQMEAKQ